MMKVTRGALTLLGVAMLSGVTVPTACSALSVGAMPMYVAADDGTTSLYVTRRESVSLEELLSALEKMGAQSATELPGGVVKVVFAAGAGSEGELRQKLALTFGVASVTDVDLSAVATAPSSTAPVTVPGIDDGPVTTEVPKVTNPEAPNGTNRGVAWMLLGVLGALAALVGGGVLLADVRRRVTLRAGEAAFRDGPDLEDLSLGDARDAPGRTRLSDDEK